MGLLTGLQTEADDVERRAQVQNTQANRRVSGYNKEVDALTGAIAPHKKNVEDFNAIVDHYNSGRFNNGTPYAVGFNGALLPLTQHGQADINDPGISAPAGYSPRNVGSVLVGDRGRSIPVNVYEKTAPPSAEKVAAATASNAFLANQKGAIDAVNAKGKSVTARNGIVQSRAKTEAERFNTTIDMQKRAINEAQAPQSASVFDQNMASIHQTIADWLR